MNYKLEICVDSIESVHNAYRAGAHRVELCSALTEGGLTPSLGLIKAAVAVDPMLDVMVMIRPRMGDFLYSDAEKEIMLSDVDMARELGAAGIVFGALTPKGDIDIAFTEELIRRAGCGMSVTFHRAFDVCRDQHLALSQLISLGVERILTSGGAKTAPDGIHTLESLCHAAQGKLIIMPGGGITPSNIKHLCSRTRASEYHCSAKSAITSAMLYKNPTVSMGAEGIDEYQRAVADENTIRKLLSLLKEAENNIFQ